jgi:hypothetical protein
MVSKRDTRFPGPGQLPIPKAPLKKESTALLTQYPSELSPIPEEINLPIDRDTKGKAAPTPPQLPVRASPSSAVASKPPPVRDQSPWDIYRSLRPLDRGGEVIAAYRLDPVKMVAVKKVSSDYIKGRGVSHHKNLLAILEQYRYDGELFVITDYTVTTLKTLIRVPIPFEERHVSATCKQGSPSFGPKPTPLTSRRF